MWFFLLMMVLNGALDNKGFVLEQRISVAGVPVNILDGLTYLGVLVIIFGPMFGAKRFATHKMHPLMVASMILFGLATFVGAFGGAMNGATRPGVLYNYLAEARNVTTFPIAIACGYYFLKFPKSNVRFVYAYVIAGMAAATLILLFFVGKSSSLKAGQLVDSIRAVDYVSFYAGLAGALLLYTLFKPDMRVFPLPVTVMLMGYCLIGQFATLTRSEWLSAAAAIGALGFVVPNQGMMSKWLITLVGLPLAGLAVSIGLVALSSMTDRDLAGSMGRRVVSLLPGQRGDDSFSSVKAWDTRLPGMKREFELWTQSPLIGHGFAYTMAGRLVVDDTAFYHNVWVSVSAVMGVFGFAAYATPVVGMIVVGRRMVRESIDRGSTLIGVVGCTTGAFALVIGISTMSFNVQRPALCIGMIAGVVMRARAMQIAVLKELEEYAGYIDPAEADQYYSDGQGVHQLA